MALPDLLDPLLMDDIEGGAQAVEVMRRRRAAVVLIKLLRMGARRPVPIAAHAGQTRTGFLGPIVEKDEGHARRHHQPLLRSGDHDIDAPSVHLKALTAQ